MFQAVDKANVSTLSIILHCSPHNLFLRFQGLRRIFNREKLTLNVKDDKNLVYRYAETYF